MKRFRKIKSFIKRERHLSNTKQKIVNELWLKYGLTNDEKTISLKQIFEYEQPLTLEIGFGNGETIFALAKKNNDQNFIGIEIYKPGVASLLSFLNNEPLKNIRIYQDDASIILEKNIPDNSLDKILILFPDPWPKKRHYKRRLVQPKLIELINKKLKSNGILHIATDWQNYAEHTIKIMNQNPNFEKINTNLSEFQRPLVTKFEQRGKKLGYEIFDLVYKSL